MKKALLLILPLFLLLAAPARAHEIVAVLDSDRPHYQQVLQGFSSALLAGPSPARGVKAITPSTLTTVTVNNPEQAATAIRARRPDLILALGSDALKAATLVDDIPVIYLLTPDAMITAANRARITGIDLRIPPQLQIEALRRHLPAVKRLGVVYDPGRSAQLIAQAKSAVANTSLQLVAATAATTREALQQIIALADRIDAYWMIPDLTVLTPATLEALFLQSLQRRIPVVTFADKYLESGAAVSITFDLDGMGRQAGEMASGILAGTPVGKMSPRPVDRVTVKFNDRIIARMGLTVSRPTTRGGQP
ncbi:MAG: hypothetical protein OEV91_06095 [Desulfobulbaceae bacterium]|nr:hypothetical protein [Desulfobulbaceae bacterium]